MSTPDCSRCMAVVCRQIVDARCVVSAAVDPAQLIAQLPIIREIGPYHVVVPADLSVHRQLPADFKDFTHAAAQRYGPLLRALRLPVDGQDRRSRKISTALEV